MPAYGPVAHAASARPTLDAPAMGRSASPRAAGAGRSVGSGSGKGSNAAWHAARSAVIAGSVHRNPPTDEAEASAATQGQVSAPVAASSPPSAPPAAAVPTLARELRLLERSRAALAHGAAGEAIALLDQHTREFPQGSLATESAALRIEALAALHRNDEAAASAKAFLNRYPDTPLAERVRSIAQKARRATGPADGPL